MLLVSGLTLLAKTRASQSNASNKDKTTSKVTALLGDSTKPDSLPMLIEPEVREEKRRLGSDKA